MIRHQVLIFAAFAWTISARSSNFPYEARANANLTVRWNVDYANEIVHFELRLRGARENALVAFGLSGRGQTTDADLFVVWTDDERRLTHRDAHTDNDSAIIAGREEENYHLMSAKRRHGMLISLEFWRSIETCDTNDYQPDNGTVHLITAVVPSGLPDADGIRLNELNPTITPVQLLRPDIYKHLPSLPKDTKTIDILVKNAHVPAKETTYFCALRKLPKLHRKHHIVRYDFVPTAATLNVVHHLEVFHCQLSPQTELESFDGPCDAEVLPEELNTCRSVLAAWAMGAEPMIYPTDVGIPIGQRSQSRYVLIQIHYNNPQLIGGLVDNSGLRLYYTKHVRKHDIGILELGVSYNADMAVPPGQREFTLVGDCTSACTETGLPRAGVTIVASQMHSHLTGRKMLTRHIDRRGVEQPEINRDDHYDPGFQQIRLLGARRRVRPGDSLLTTCAYDTSDRTEVTLGGYAISDEMCVNYVHYYPKSNLEVCKSTADRIFTDQFFKEMRRLGDDTDERKSAAENYRAIHWTPAKVAKLQRDYRELWVNMECTQNSGFPWPGQRWDGQPQVEVKRSLETNHSSCAQAQSKISKMYNKRVKNFERVEPIKPKNGRFHLLELSRQPPEWFDDDVAANAIDRMRETPNLLELPRSEYERMKSEEMASTEREALLELPRYKYSDERTPTNFRSFLPEWPYNK